MVLFILSLRSRPGLKLKTNDADRRTLRYDRKNRRGEDPLTFFGVQALPQPQIDPELLTSVDAAQAANDWNAELLNLLDMAMSAVDDFAAGFFRALGYAKHNRVARTRRDLSLLICGEFRHAQTDVCIVDRDHNDILLVQEDKRFEEGEGGDPQAQLIAEAIAAFGINNEQRVNADVDPLDEKVCPIFFSVSLHP